MITAAFIFLAIVAVLALVILLMSANAENAFGITASISALWISLGGIVLLIAIQMIGDIVIRIVVR